MKKRMVVLLLVMIMISGLCVNAMATERASQIKPKLSFSGKTANCSVTVVEAGELDVTLELWNGSEMVDSWSDSGTNYLNVSGSHAAVSGTTYTLIAHGTIGSKHSAIITSVSAGTGVNQIVVASKWGHYGVYSHILSDCPYYTDAEHGTTHYLTNVKYYRLSHQYILSGNYYYCKCCGYKNPTMVVSGVTK